MPRRNYEKDLCSISVCEIITRATGFVRNTYVHQGVSSVEDTPDYYLNWSKQYAEAAIRILIWLYNNRAIWKDNDDIDIFFDHYSQSSHKLELAGKVLRGRSVRVA